MTKPKLSYDEPHDDLTELAAVGLEALIAAAQEGDRLVCFVLRRDGRKMRSGLALNGYDGHDQLLADMLAQTQAVAHTAGKAVLIAPLRKG